MSIKLKILHKPTEPKTSKYLSKISSYIGDDFNISTAIVSARTIDTSEYSTRDSIEVLLK